MATPQEILADMFDNAEGDVEDLDAQLAQIDQLISNLEDEATAIEDALMTVAADDLQAYLDSTKLPEIIISTGQDLALIIGSNYNDLPNVGGSANLTDWSFVDTTSLQVIYSRSVNWDGDVLILDWIADWDFGDDYLTHPLTTFDGTYGIYPNINTLNNARGSVQATRTKVNNSIGVFGDYV